MIDHVTKAILSATEAKQIVDTTLIHDLWSGYGKIMRCKLEVGVIPSVVVKHVQLLTSLDHPRGWNTNRSHEKNTSPISLKSNGMQA